MIARHSAVRVLLLLQDLPVPPTIPGNDASDANPVAMVNPLMMSRVRSEVGGILQLDLVRSGRQRNSLQDVIGRQGLNLTPVNRCSARRNTRGSGSATAHFRAPMCAAVDAVPPSALVDERLDWVSGIYSSRSPD